MFTFRGHKRWTAPQPKTNSDLVFCVCKIPFSIDEFTPTYTYICFNIFHFLVTFLFLYTRLPTTSMYFRQWFQELSLIVKLLFHPKTFFVCFFGLRWPYFLHYAIKYRILDSYSLKKSTSTPPDFRLLPRYFRIYVHLFPLVDRPYINLRLQSFLVFAFLRSDGAATCHARLSPWPQRLHVNGTLLYVCLRLIYQIS